MYVCLYTLTQFTYKQVKDGFSQKLSQKLKFKKIGAIIVISIMVLVSFAYYENSTKPKGLTFESGYYTNFYVTPGTFEIFALHNASFLGNNIN